MNSSSPLPDSEDVLKIVFNLIRDHRELSLAIAAAGLLIIVVSVAVISVCCDRICHKRSRRAFAPSEAVTGSKDPPSPVADQKGGESARPKDADAEVVENRQTGPSSETACSTVSELEKQPLKGKDGGTSNDKSPSCGENTETDKCLPNQSTPKDPISPKETSKETPKEAPKDPISPKETSKETPKETPKDPISINEANKGQDGATTTGTDLGAAHQSAVDRAPNRSEGEFNQVNDLNDIALKTIEDSLDLMAAACFQNQKYDEDLKTHGQNGPPQLFDIAADTRV